jgi:hypothetical protein
MWVRFTGRACHRSACRLFGKYVLLNISAGWLQVHVLARYMDFLALFRVRFDQPSRFALVIFRHPVIGVSAAPRSGHVGGGDHPTVDVVASVWLAEPTFRQGTRNIPRRSTALVMVRGGQYRPDSTPSVDREPDSGCGDCAASRTAGHDRTSLGEPNGRTRYVMRRWCVTRARS